MRACVRVVYCPCMQVLFLSMIHVKHVDIITIDVVLVDTYGDLVEVERMDLRTWLKSQTSVYIKYNSISNCSVNAHLLFIVS